MPVLTDSLPLVKFGIPFFQNFDQISGSKADSRISLIGKASTDWMAEMHKSLIDDYLKQVMII